MGWGWRAPGNGDQGGLAPVVRNSWRRLEITTKRDLLMHVPLRYEERGQAREIASLSDGENALVVAAVAAPPAHTRPRKGLSLWRVAVSDGTGIMTAVFFQS